MVQSEAHSSRPNANAKSVGEAVALASLVVRPHGGRPALSKRRASTADPSVSLFRHVYG